MGEDYRDIKEGVTNYVYIGTIIFLVLAILFILFLVISLQKRNRMIREKKQLQIDFKQELLRTQLEIQEQTLKNISQEIHDNIGQGLTLAKLNLSLMNANESKGLAVKIEDSKKLVAIGLVRSIEYELKMIEKTGSYKTSFELTGDIQKLTPQNELILFRIVQEVLNNIIKHANGKHIIIQAAYSMEHLQLTIRDDGEGFELQKINMENTGQYGLGLRNMHNRAKLIGAEFILNSIKGNGTEVKLQIPILTNNQSKNGNQS